MRPVEQGAGTHMPPLSLPSGPQTTVPWSMYPASQETSQTCPVPRSLQTLGELLMDDSGHLLGSQTPPENWPSAPQTGSVPTSVKPALQCTRQAPPTGTLPQSEAEFGTTLFLQSVISQAPPANAPVGRH